MIYTSYDYLNKYQSALGYIIGRAVTNKYATPHIEKMIAYSIAFSDFEKSNVTTLAFTSKEKIYESIFGTNDKEVEVSDNGLFGWIGYAYINMFFKHKVTFELLFMVFPIREMIEKYSFLHEMNISQVVNIFKLRVKYTYLDLIMDKKNVSSAALSKGTGISESSINALRYGIRDINKTQFEFVKLMANYLNVKIESLGNLIVKTSK